MGRVGRGGGGGEKGVDKTSLLKRFSERHGQER